MSTDQLSPDIRRCHSEHDSSGDNNSSMTIREVPALVNSPPMMREQLSASPGSGKKLEEEGTSIRRPSISVLFRNKTPSDLHADSAAATPELCSGNSEMRTYTVDADDEELRDIVRRSLKKRGQGKDEGTALRHGQLRELVFTRQYSTFDRQNQQAANSPFYGFYVLFWIAVVFWIIKMAADNWRKTGNPLGTNEIMKIMFRRDVILLLLSDGMMCALTGVSWAIQLLVLHDYIDWNRTGWIIQNVWQSLFIGNVIGLTLLRDWPWTHTVFFVLHGLVMLMKQHSYAFYNGHLSSVYKKRRSLLGRLKKLEDLEPVDSPSLTMPKTSALSTSHLARRPSATEYQEKQTFLAHDSSREQDDLERISQAIEEGRPLDLDQVLIFERLIKWEIDALASELRGKATQPSRQYPANVSLANHYEYIVLPTVVYELEYPRSERIDVAYVAEKAAATVGLLFVMNMVSQTLIYPVVMRAVAMKEMGYTTAQRLAEFPWMLSDLVFPFMMEYLLAWYLIWETVLNILAELTLFADRNFYDAWWNSVSWDQFARDWNRPVHDFLLRHVYQGSISSLRVGRPTATLMTFFLSACVHELLMWCIFKKLRGYLLALQMCQLPLVRLGRTRWLRGRKVLGNAIFWTGILTGPSLLCSLYLIL